MCPHHVHSFCFLLLCFCISFLYRSVFQRGKKDKWSAVLVIRILYLVISTNYEEKQIIYHVIKCSISMFFSEHEVNHDLHEIPFQNVICHAAS